MTDRKTCIHCKERPETHAATLHLRKSNLRTELRGCSRCILQFEGKPMWEIRELQ